MGCKSSSIKWGSPGEQPFQVGVYTQIRVICTHRSGSSAHTPRSPAQKTFTWGGVGWLGLGGWGGVGQSRSCLLELNVLGTRKRMNIGMGCGGWGRRVGQSRSCLLYEHLGLPKGYKIYHHIDLPTKKNSQNDILHRRQNTDQDQLTFPRLQNPRQRQNRPEPNLRNNDVDDGSDFKSDMGDVNNAHDEMMI